MNEFKRVQEPGAAEFKFHVFPREGVRVDVGSGRLEKGVSTPQRHTGRIVGRV
jgi:hypothetical protein